MSQCIQSQLQSRNVTIDGHRTSLRLERDTWVSLEEICLREKMSVHDVCTLVERCRIGSSRTAAVRSYILAYFREAASDIGHSRAGHGMLKRKKVPSLNISKVSIDSKPLDSKVTPEIHAGY